MSAAPQPSSDPSAAGAPDAAAVARVLDERYSCRAFRPTPVPEDVLDALFARAQRAPSWCNSQAWQVTLVSGARRDDFAERLTAWVGGHPPVSDLPAPTSYDGVYADRRRAAGYALYSALGIDRSDRDARGAQMLENFRFFGAPHVAVVTSAPGLGVYGAIDCGGYVATLATVATSMGLATCPQAALALYSDGVREILEIPDDRVIVCGVALGYADDAHAANSFRTDRAGVADVVTRLG